MKKSLPVWRVRAKADKRFRSGHPWVYSNELQESPKGIEPGEPVELQDAGGVFLARGYGNPSSLIAFRALTRDPLEREPHSSEAILKTLQSAGKLRGELGLAPFSYRLCFGEADALPGLIVDRFVLEGSPSCQVFVVQIHTAGMDRLQEALPSILEKYAENNTDIPWIRTAVIFRNDLSVRKLEGIREEEPRIVRGFAFDSGIDLQNARIQVREAFDTGQKKVVFNVDLLEGQKTGFFLDQASNVQLALQRLASWDAQPAKKKVRILDLCCYVGQWSVQIARAFRAQGIEVEVTCMDASAQALQFARRNVEAGGVSCETIQGDVLKDLASLSDHCFDWVISDPPALIKGRKDIPAGTHAYLTLNTQVFRLVRRGGTVVSCSCSGLLEDDEFIRVLSKAAYRNRARVRWVGRGAQGPDHPMVLEFPEGRYLKCWIGWVA